MSNEARHIWVVGIWFESESVFERYSEGENEVYGRDLLQKIFFRRSLTFIDVHPNVASKVSAVYGERCPSFPTIRVSLVCSGAAEGECETDDETQDCEEESIDADC